MAVIAEAAIEAEEADDEESGEIPLSPIQHWFFDANMPQPAHWNQSKLFDLPSTYDAQRLEAALQSTIAAHPLLSARFSKGERGWVQALNSNDGESFQMETCSVSFSDSEAFHDTCLRWQSSLDLEQGPLWRIVVLQDTSGNNAHRLLFVVHHVVVDTVSWQILIDDIVHCYQNSSNSLPAEHCQFGKYVKHLENGTAETAESPEKVDYWNDIAQSINRFRLPLPIQTIPITEGAIQSITRTLDADSTELLRDEANVAFSTTPQQLLLAALALALTDWTGHEAAIINLESHGREGFGLEQLDLSRSIGWMTAVFPAVLKVDSDIVATVKRIKDYHNQHSIRGIEYGALKRFLGSPDDRKLTSSVPEVLFNFLGVQSALTNSLLNPVPLKPQSCRSENNYRQHPIEINAVIQDKKLSVEFSTCQHLVSSDVGGKLADDFVNHLVDVITTCVEADQAFTASDFAESGMSQADLDEFLSSID